MKNRFVVSDTHFGHKGVCTFLRGDGVTKLRPWDDPAEMDEAMVELWNATVKPGDTVYHLGDVVINRKALPILNRLNGDKVLMKGNHDIFKLHDYTPYFRDIRAYTIYDNIVFSHIPIHPDSKARFAGNIHGHLHANKLDDPWYLCVCVEQTDFKPLPIEEAYKRLKEQNNVC